jgi:hypothetical protein
MMDIDIHHLRTKERATTLKKRNIIIEMIQRIVDLVDDQLMMHETVFNGRPR